MKFVLRFSFFLVLIAPVISNSQTVPDPSKEKLRKLTILVDEILSDIPSLRLGSNRAFLYAKAGVFLCKADPERSRGLLLNSIGELLNAQMLAETEKKTNPPNELISGRITRPKVLNAIAQCDAEFALQSLYRSRPAAIERALTAGSEKPTKISNNPGNVNFIVQNENQLEQNLLRLAADQNPDRAVALLKESLKRDLSGETYNLLKKLHAKDPDEANRLASNVVDKLIQKGFVQSNQPIHQNIHIASVILNEFIREKGTTEKSLRFEDSQMKSLAEKLFTAYLDSPTNYGYFDPRSILKYAEKLSPGNVARIKAREKTNVESRGYGRQGDPGINTLFSSNPTAEKLIAEAKNFPLESRSQIYTAAANKLADSDNLGAANALLSEHFGDDALSNASESLNWYYAHRLMNLGKYAEAEQMINDFPERNRISGLIALAHSIFNKDKVENKETATSVLDRVYSLMSDRPLNQNELSQIMQLANGYSHIEPEKCFQVLDSLVPLLSELTDASILIFEFQGHESMQKGEFLVGQGMPFQFHLDTSILWKLAETDLDRTIKFANRFTRPEMRLTLKLQIADQVFGRN